MLTKKDENSCVCPGTESFSKSKQVFLGPESISSLSFIEIHRERFEMMCTEQQKDTGNRITSALRWWK